VRPRYYEAATVALLATAIVAAAFMLFGWWGR
jgi:hypothetical protein